MRDKSGIHKSVQIRYPKHPLIDKGLQDEMERADILGEKSRLTILIVVVGSLVRLIRQIMMVTI